MEKKWTKLYAMTWHVKIICRSKELLFGTHAFNFNCFFDDFNCIFMQICCLSVLLGLEVETGSTHSYGSPPPQMYCFSSNPPSFNSTMITLSRDIARKFEKLRFAEKK